ncbi:MAG TPA: aldo/keto reductase [bacterium]|nr:aldo/keto reductase [bacterium]
MTEHRIFGSTGVQVPIVGQGTWEMDQDGVERSVAALRRGLDLGMTHIDTAESYGSGEVEEIVGKAITGRRPEVFLVSKVSPGRATRRGTIQACEESLRRLGTDHLDCYLLHWPGRHPLAETFAAFELLVRDGKIKAWGISNFNEEEVEEAVRIAGTGRIACNQVLYHLEERAIEHHVIPACEEHNIAVVAYSPFSQGRFRSHRVLEDIARSKGVSARQVALRFLLRHPGTFTIPKSATMAHVEENAGAADLQLTDGEISRIDQAFPTRKPRRGHLPVL